jgi:hypothetical protein
MVTENEFGLVKSNQKHIATPGALLWENVFKSMMLCGSLT